MSFPCILFNYDNPIVAHWRRFHEFLTGICRLKKSGSEPITLTIITFFTQSCADMDASGKRHPMVNRPICWLHTYFCSLRLRRHPRLAHAESPRRLSLLRGTTAAPDLASSIERHHFRAEHAHRPRTILHRQRVKPAFNVARGQTHQPAIVPKQVSKPRDHYIRCQNSTTTASRAAH